MSNTPFLIKPSSVSPDAIKADLVAWLQAQSDYTQWSTFYASTSGQGFIDLVAGFGAFLKYDSMMARQESFLQLAQNRSSIIAEGQFLGYDAFRGRNAILSITFTPTASGVLNLWSSLGSVKSLEMLVLTPTAYTIGVPCTVQVLLGNTATQTLIAPNANLNVFRFTTPNVSKDLRIYVDDVEVQSSNNISDLLNGLFTVQTNSIGSVDAKYLNSSTFTTVYTAGSEVRLDWVELNNLTFNLSDVAVDPAIGTITASSIVSFYQTIESTTSIQVNAPLENETKNAVRGRNDMQKIYKKLNSTFVDAEGTDVSAAVIKVIGLAGDNYLRLSAMEKVAAQNAFTPYRMNGLQPPIIGDPSEMAITLSIILYLNTAIAGDVNALVTATLATYLNVLSPVLNLYNIENTLTVADFVRIARVSIEGPTWASATRYPRGKFVSPPTPNGFVYRAKFLRYFTGVSEPVWPVVEGNTINNGTLQFTAVANASPGAIPAWTASTAHVLLDYVKPTVANGFVYVVSKLLNFSGATEPTWTPIPTGHPASELVGSRTNDNQLIWVARLLVGTPAVWAANHDYNAGDLVVASNPTSAHTVGLMFQAMDYRGLSGGSAPIFPTVVGTTVNDNQLTWVCVDPAAEELVLDVDQYLTITPDITTR